MGDLRWLFAAGAVVVFVMAVSADTRADEFVSGNDLMEACTSNREFCYGYIEGIADEWMAMPSCLNLKGVQVQQLADVVVRLLTAHPERRHHGASLLVVEALAVAILANEAAAPGAAPDAVMQTMSPWMAVLLGVGAGLMVSACWHLTCGGK